MEERYRCGNFDCYRIYLSDCDFFVSNQKDKEANAESIDKAADILRRIGYADKKAITEDWEYLKKSERKWIICEAWERVLDEFLIQGNAEAAKFLAYCVGDEIMKYFEERRDFYQKADERAHTN